MILEPVRGGDIDEAISIYLSSFPPQERADVDVLLSRLGRDDTELLGMYDPGLCGIVYSLYNDDAAYLLYLAVAPGHRGSGLGTKALEAFALRYPGRKFFLDIETPYEGLSDTAARLRRKAFYTRNGFSCCGRLLCTEGDYDTMCRNDSISPEEVSRFVADLELESLFGDYFADSIEG